MDQVGLHVRAALADAAIAPAAFPAVDLLQVAVHPDEEDVQVGPQPGQASRQLAYSMTCSTIRSLPAAASTGRHR